MLLLLLREVDEELPLLVADELLLLPRELDTELLLLVADELLLLPRELDTELLLLVADELLLLPRELDTELLLFVADELLLPRELDTELLLFVADELLLPRELDTELLVLRVEVPVEEELSLRRTVLVEFVCLVEEPTVAFPVVSVRRVVVTASPRVLLSVRVALLLPVVREALLVVRRLSDVTAVRWFSSESTFTRRLFSSREGIFTNPALRSRRLFS